MRVQTTKQGFRQVNEAEIYCASSAPAPLIPPRLTEIKAQHEGSIAEHALDAELTRALSSMLCILCIIARWLAWWTMNIASYSLCSSSSAGANMRAECRASWSRIWNHFRPKSVSFWAGFWVRMRPGHPWLRHGQHSSSL